MARSTKESRLRQSSRDARGMTATQLLKKDHATVKQLFARFEKQGERAQETKQTIFSEIQRELETHSTIEEEIFYPAVRESVAGTEDLVDESLEEHNVVKSLLRDLGSMSAEDEEFDAKMTVLQENVEHHVQEEEGEMFPKVEAQLGHQRLQELGTQMQARKDALGQPTIKRIMSGVSGLIFGESTEERDTARTQTRGRSGGKSSAKQRGANKKGAGAARAARKPLSASAKKRSSGRSAETKGSARRSRGHKRTAAGGGNRRRSSGRSSKRR